MEGIMGAIKACEELRSPAIIEIFPWSIHFQGPEFVQFAADKCKNAKVPISLHLDHCIEEKDVYLALDLPFDSIMVDASSSDPEVNYRMVSNFVRLAAERGITIEAELGRIVGSEDGLPQREMEELLTEPEDAAAFIKNTGIHFLAPSIGNVHGPYPPGGPEKYWQLDRLEKIHKACPGIPLVLHGAFPAIPPLMRKTFPIGIRKINFNKNNHDHWLEYMEKNLSKEVTRLLEGSVEAFVEQAKFCIDIVGSAGKA
jgi:fructose-bisphosphate aldolase class II